MSSIQRRKCDGHFKWLNTRWSRSVKNNWFFIHLSFRKNNSTIIFYKLNYWLFVSRYSVFSENLTDASIVHDIVCFLALSICQSKKLANPFSIIFKKDENNWDPSRIQPLWERNWTLTSMKTFSTTQIRKFSTTTKKCVSSAKIFFASLFFFFTVHV